MNDKFNLVRSYCLAHANAAQNSRNARYFSEGYDGYGLDQKEMESERDKWLEEWLPEIGVNGFLDLGDQLVRTGKYEEASFALMFAHKLLNMKLNDSSNVRFFERIGHWFDEGGISNWAQTDVGSAWLVSGAINRRIVMLEVLYKWTSSPSRWKRRAAAVAPILVMRAGTYPIDSLLAVLEPLMTDHEKVVQQGVGSTLKQFWVTHPDQTETFLLKWQSRTSRLIIRLATEKMSNEQKKEFRPKKPLPPKKIEIEDAEPRRKSYVIRKIDPNKEN